MPRPRRVSDDAILDAVIAEMAQRGPLLSLAAVAERVNVSETVLFQRFGNRAGLLDAAIARATPSDWASVFEPAPDPSDIARQLVRIGRGLAHLMNAMQLLASLLILARVTPAEWLGREDIPTVLNVRRRLEAWLDAAQACGAITVEDTELAAGLFMGSIQLNAFDPARSDQDAHIRKVIDVVFALQPPEDASPEAGSRAARQPLLKPAPAP